MSIKAFIFDLDGVIVNTAKYHYLAWKRLCDELGFSFTPVDNELLKGVSRTRSFEIILSLNKAQMSEKEIAEKCELKNTYYLEYIHTLKEDEILPGVSEFLTQARDRGLLLAIGSASKNCMEILTRLDLVSCFDQIVDGTKVSKAKPDPEVFVRGSELLGVDPCECVVFEDSIAGVIAAHNGGMKAVGVTSAEVRSQCDYFIEGFDTIDVDTVISRVH